jgi:hypothetical protein
MLPPAICVGGFFFRWHTQGSCSHHPKKDNCQPPSISVQNFMLGCLAKFNWPNCEYILNISTQGFQFQGTETDGLLNAIANILATIGEVWTPLWCLKTYWQNYPGPLKDHGDTVLCKNGEVLWEFCCRQMLPDDV